MNGRILVVDDEPMVLDSVARYLSLMGFEVRATQDVFESLEIFRQESFDLIITDLRMPGMGGMELIDQINAIDPDVPKIIFTGLGTKTDAIEAIHKGVFDYLEKPLDNFSQIAVTASRAIEQRQLIQEKEAMKKRLEDKNVELSSYVKELETVRSELYKQTESLQEAHDLIKSQYRILQEDLVNARRIQQDLLPKEYPEVEGLHFSGFYYPSNKIGGDFFDVYRVDDDHIGFYVADVAGHGVSSAMMTVFVKQTVTERLLLTDEAVPINPADVLKELNLRLVQKRFQKSMFLTAWCGLYSIKDRVLQYSSGGHLPIILVRSGGEIIELTTEGMAVGWTRQARYTVRQIQLQPGDWLFLYTDGLTDAAPKGREPFGKQRIIDHLKKRNDESSMEMLQGLLNHFREYMGESPIQDDISLLLFGLDGESHA